MKILKYFLINRYKIFISFSICLLYANVGASITAFGSAILDLGIRADADFSRISHIIPARSAGHIFGATLSDFLANRMSMPVALVFASLLHGITFSVAPFFIKYEAMLVCFFISGTGQGLIEVFSNLLLVNIWKEKSSNWLQVLCMGYGVGALFSPLIMRLFLLPSQGESEIQSTILSNNSSINSSQQVYTSKNVQVQYAFQIFGIWAIITAAAFFYCHLKEKNKPKIDIAKKTIKESSAQPAQWKIYVAVGLTASLAYSIYGIQSITGTLGASFTVKSDLRMAKETGVLVATVFWFCCAFSRLIFIPITLITSDEMIVIVNLIILTLGIIVTVVWGAFYQIAIWIGFTLMGAGISPIYAIVFCLLEKYFHLNSRLASIIVTLSNLGDSLNSAILTPLMADNPILFIYYIAGLGVGLVVCTSILLVFCDKVFPKPSGNHRGRPTVVSPQLSISSMYK